VRVGARCVAREPELLADGWDGVVYTQVLRISYMDAKHEADLNADGFIYYRGDKFSSPSAWSIHVKRLANPSKKADDGWKSVRYVPSGKTLEHYKSQVRTALLARLESDGPLASFRRPRGATPA